MSEVDQTAILLKVQVCQFVNDFLIIMLSKDIKMCSKHKKISKPRVISVY